jgi:hypothetical protein
MDKMEMKHQLLQPLGRKHPAAPYTIQRQGHNAAARVRPYF